MMMMMTMMMMMMMMMVVATMMFQLMPTMQVFINTIFHSNSVKYVALLPQCIFVTLSVFV